MTIYVDDMDMRADVPNGARVVRGRWSHLMSDGGTDELVAFACDVLRLRRSWIQYEATPKEHFDVVASKKRLALQRGAVQITWRESALLMGYKVAVRDGDVPPGTWDLEQVRRLDRLDGEGGLW